MRLDERRKCHDHMLFRRTRPVILKRFLKWSILLSGRVLFYRYNMENERAGEIPAFRL